MNRLFLALLAICANSPLFAQAVPSASPLVRDGETQLAKENYAERAASAFGKELLRVMCADGQ